MVSVQLSISTTTRPATVLGHLLHKHPDRVQRFPQTFGEAVVFYPEATDERCTAVLLLEVDQVNLARTLGRKTPDYALAQYVNDRSYAASSLLSVALGRVFATARAGRCDSHPEVAVTPMPLEIEIPVLPCRGGREVARRIFEPLGWQVEANAIALDEAFPEWGDSRYVQLRLTGTALLSEALNQLYLLLPVLDESKHYWQGPDEADKLLRAGAGWLATHPEVELITRRYLRRSGAQVSAVLARLIEISGQAESEFGDPGDDDPAQASTAPIPLRVQRHDAVLAELTDLGAVSVADLGCGGGAFLERLVAQPRFIKVVGMDVSAQALKSAAKRLHLDTLTERQADRIDLFQGALTYRDDRIAGFDAAVLMEVIEHVDPPRLRALADNVFGAAHPAAVIVTTPNNEYNALFDAPDEMRHTDHRFEWDRADFADWCTTVAARHGYQVRIVPVGPIDPALGAPTQMGVFTRDER